jgi:hypothetical protein
MDKIKKLKATINELDKKHQNELVEAIGNKIQHNVDIAELQERLATETCKADIFRQEYFELEQEAKERYEELLAIISNDKERFQVLEVMIRKVQNARINEVEEYNNKLRTIKNTINQVHEYYVSGMVNKIDFSARESLWMVTQLNRLMKERRSLLERCFKLIIYSYKKHSTKILSL